MARAGAGCTRSRCRKWNTARTVVGPPVAARQCSASKSVFPALASGRLHSRGTFLCHAPRRRERPSCTTSTSTWNPPPPSPEQDATTQSAEKDKGDTCMLHIPTRPVASAETCNWTTLRETSRKVRRREPSTTHAYICPPPALHFVQPAPPSPRRCRGSMADEQASLDDLLSQ